MLDDCATRRALVLPSPAGLHQVGVTATRAGAIDRFVPGDEVAGRVSLATKERATLLRPTFDNLPFAAGWTAYANPGQERTRVATIRESAARLEFSELP